MRKLERKLRWRVEDWLNQGIKEAPLKAALGEGSRGSLSKGVWWCRKRKLDGRLRQRSDAGFASTEGRLCVRPLARGKDARSNKDVDAVAQQRWVEGWKVGMDESVKQWPEQRLGYSSAFTQIKRSPSRLAEHIRTGTHMLSKVVLASKAWTWREIRHGGSGWGRKSTSDAIPTQYPRHASQHEQRTRRSRQERWRA